MSNPFVFGAIVGLRTYGLHQGVRGFLLLLSLIQLGVIVPELAVVRGPRMVREDLGS